MFWSSTTTLVQRRALEETIRRFGYAVTTVDTGEKAIATLKADASGDISLVLLDLVMPRTGGMAVLSRIAILAAEISGHRADR